MQTINTKICYKCEQRKPLIDFVTCHNTISTKCDCCRKRVVTLRNKRNIELDLMPLETVLKRSRLPEIIAQRTVLVKILSRNFRINFMRMARMMEFDRTTLMHLLRRYDDDILYNNKTEYYGYIEKQMLSNNYLVGLLSPEQLDSLINKAPASLMGALI